MSVLAVIEAQIFMICVYSQSQKNLIKRQLLTILGYSLVYKYTPKKIFIFSFTKVIIYNLNFPNFGPS